MSTKLLVCGGRNFREMGFALVELNRIASERQISLVIHGAATGADTLAAAWAALNGISTAAYPAQWAKHGKAAGPLRNQQMLDEARPDLVVAFPGGRGTADMVRRARKAGVPVIEILRNQVVPHV